MEYRICFVFTFYKILKKVIIDLEFIFNISEWSFHLYANVRFFKTENNFFKVMKKNVNRESQLKYIYIYIYLYIYIYIYIYAFLKSFIHRKYHNFLQIFQKKKIKSKIQNYIILIFSKRKAYHISSYWRKSYLIIFNYLRANTW